MASAFGVRPAWPLCICGDLATRTWNGTGYCRDCYYWSRYQVKPPALHVCSGCGRTPVLGCECISNRREIMQGERRKFDEGR